KPFNSVFAFQVDSARKNLLFVFEDGFDHFYRRGGWRVVSGTGLQQIDDLRAAFARAFNNRVDAILWQQIGKRNAGYIRIAREWNHVIAVPAENERVHILDADFALHSDEGTHACGVEHSGHAENALFGEATHFISSLRHGIERISDHYDDAVGRMFDDLFD